MNEDPDDVYRVHVGARQQIVVTVTPEDDVRAALLDPATRTVEAVRRRELAVADGPGKAVERLVYANRARRPAVLFLHVTSGEAGTGSSRAYSVSITRTPVPR